MKSYKDQGRLNKKNGRDFELRVRKDIESKGWVCSKWMNQVELEPLNVSIEKKIKLTGSGWLNGRIGKLIPARHKFAGPGRPMSIGTGFPDFIAFKQAIPKTIYCGKDVGKKGNFYYEVIGVECKVNGYLDKEEREKCDWLLENNIFDMILIASKEKIKNKISINYKKYEPK